MKKTLLLRTLALLLVLCMTAAFAGCGALNAYVEIKDAVDTLNGADAPDTPESPDQPDTPVEPDNSDQPDAPDTPDTPEEPKPAEPEEDPESGELTAADSLAELRSGIDGTGCIAAIAYIGRIEGPMGDGYDNFFVQQGYTYWYPFINEIPYDRFVETDGYELYCIVPRDADASVAVNQWFMREYAGTVGGSTGNVLYRSESGEPFLLLCNLNETIPNADVNIVSADGETVSFNPLLYRFDDGTVCVQCPDNVLDFTLPMVEQFVGETAEVTGLTGSWRCESALTPAGDPLVCKLEFYIDEYGSNRVSYWYGAPYSEIYEFFDGVWYSGDQDPSVTMFEMELVGGVALEEVDPYWFRGAYRITVSPQDGDLITVTHLDGTPLIYGCEGGAFEFQRSSAVG